MQLYCILFEALNCGTNARSQQIIQTLGKDAIPSMDVHLHHLQREPMIWVHMSCTRFTRLTLQLCVDSGASLVLGVPL